MYEAPEIFELGDVKTLTLGASGHLYENEDASIVIANPCDREGLQI